MVRTPVDCACGDHAFVGLTKGMVALIDKDAAPHVGKRLWRARRSKAHWYAVSSAGERMHREVLGETITFDRVVDHRNGDTLDNRSANLRRCTHAENMCNRVAPKHSSSEFKGVASYGNGRFWRYKIKCGGVRRGGCGFRSAEDAAAAYDRDAMEIHGEFARLNFPLQAGGAA